MGVPGGAQTGTQTGALPVRLDKWLWAARFFKTRALSQEAIDLGQVLDRSE
jgi:ribosome-associated heat shock protein Hsp15